MTDALYGDLAEALLVQEYCDGMVTADRARMAAKAHRGQRTQRFLSTQHSVIAVLCALKDAGFELRHAVTGAVMPWGRCGK